MEDKKQPYEDEVKQLREEKLKEYKIKQIAGVVDKIDQEIDEHKRILAEFRDKIAHINELKYVSSDKKREWVVSKESY